MARLSADQAADALVEREPVKEPAKRWINWWKAGSNGTRGASCGRNCSVDHGPKKPGEIYPACIPHPSKDVALSRAAVRLEQSIRVYGPEISSRHVGAFPEGQRP